MYKLYPLKLEQLKKINSLKGKKIWLKLCTKQRLEKRFELMSFKLRDFFTKYLSNCSIRSRLSTNQLFSSVTVKKHLLPDKMLFLHFDFT